MTTRFYTPLDHVQSRVITLPPEESRHAASVLRHRIGDEIEVVDGCGAWYRVRITDIRRDRVEGQIVQSGTEVGEAPYSLRIALAPLKNPNRYEVFVEKAVELGVSTILPVITERSERLRLREDRLRRLSISAMKQCGRSRLLRFDEARTWRELLDDSPEGLRLVCHERARADETIATHLQSDDAPKEILVAIGPEGGFSEGEIEAALAVGFSPVSLGPRRLRAETAAIVAAAAVMLCRRGRSE